MIKRDQVLVRAKAHDKWVNADPLDLTQESFNAFVLYRMYQMGMVTGIKDEFVDTDRVEMIVRDECLEKYLDEHGEKR